MKRLGLLLAVIVLNGLFATAASAQLNVNINIGAPPPVILHTAPTMVFLPEPGVQVLVGTPYDIYFISNRYYYFHGNNWFYASGYDGPWIVVKTLPPGLAKYKIAKLREFRDVEYVKVKSKGKGKSQGNGNGRGNKK
jgi:hypothetical protein